MQRKRWNTASLLNVFFSVHWPCVYCLLPERCGASLDSLRQAIYIEQLRVTLLRFMQKISFFSEKLLTRSALVSNLKLSSAQPNHNFASRKSLSFSDISHNQRSAGCVLGAGNLKTFHAMRNFLIKTKLQMTHKEELHGYAETMVNWIEQRCDPVCGMIPKKPLAHRIKAWK